MEQAMQPQEQKQLTRSERRAQTKLQKQIDRANRKKELASRATFDSTSTDPDSFYERAIEWTHRADKIINLVLGYLLAIASVLGFMDVLSNGEVLGHVPFVFYIWLLIMGLGVDFQILLVIGRVPDLARMVGHPVGKWVLVTFNIVFLAFLAYVSIVIGAVFTQHRDVPGTIAQAMSILGINSTSFVYERAALATFLLILMAVDRTMERWRMQIAAGNRQQHKQGEQTIVSEEQQPAPVSAPQTSDVLQLVQAMQEMNAQNIAAMRTINDETMSRFSTVTIELVRETIERTAATVALPSASQPALPAAHESDAHEQEGIQDASESEQEGEMDVLDLDAITVRGEQQNDVQGEQETPDYGALIEGLYRDNREITVSEIVDQLGCGRSTAHKWLKRVKPVNA